MPGCLEPFDSGTAAHYATCVQESARTHGKLVQVIVLVVLEQDAGLGLSHRIVQIGLRRQVASGDRPILYVRVMKAHDGAAAIRHLASGAAGDSRTSAMFGL